MDRTRTRCRDAVAVLDEHALAFGVVVDVGDERRRRLRAAQIDVHSLEQVGFIEGWTIDAAVGSGHRDGAVERIVASCCS